MDDSLLSLSRLSPLVSLQWVCFSADLFPSLSLADPFATCDPTPFLVRRPVLIPKLALLSDLGAEEADKLCWHPSPSGIRQAGNF